MRMDYEEQMKEIASLTVKDSMEEIEGMAYEVLEKYATDYLNKWLKEIMREKCQLLLKDGIPFKIVQKVGRPLSREELLELYTQ